MTKWPFALCLTAALLIPDLPARGQEAGDENAVYDEVSTLVTLLLSESDSIRAKAAVRLGKLRASYSVEALAAALDDPSGKVRMAVVGSLGQIVTPASAKALTGAAAGDKDPDVKLAAVEALTRLHIETAYQGCVSVLQKSADDAVKKAALGCLKKWNEPYAPLPKPLPLPKGKKVPKGVAPEEVKKEALKEAEKAAPVKEKKVKEKKKPAVKAPEEKPSFAEKVNEIKEPPGYEVKKKEEEGKPEIMTEFPEEAVEEKVKPPMLSEKDELEVPSEEAYVALQAARAGVAACMTKHKVPGETLKVKVLITPGGSLGHLYVLGDASLSAETCIKDAIAALEFPPFKSSYVVDHEYQRTVGALEPTLPGLMKEEDIFQAPEKKKGFFLPLELNPIGRESVERVLFSVPHSTGGVSFTLSGEYVIKKVFGIGVELNAGSGTHVSYEDDYARKEKPLFGNLALVMRAAGAKEFPRLKILYGASLALYTPTASRGGYEDYSDPTLVSGVYASQINYYRLERLYPNINRSSRVFIRPDFGLALGTDIIHMQVELGFDLMVMGTAEYEDAYGTYSVDAGNVYLVHIGSGFYYLPISVLQLSLEITWIRDIGGRLYEYSDNPSSEPITSPGGEFFVTPAVTLGLPLGKARATMTMGFRIPTGDITNVMSNFIWVMGAGLTWP
jgi:hypothetical protein